MAGEEKFLNDLKKDLNRDFKKLDSNTEMANAIKKDLSPRKKSPKIKKEIKKAKTKTSQPKKVKKQKAKISKPKKLSYNLKDVPTLQIRDEREIALDFATKIYQRFNKIVKSVVLFGSTAKETATNGSDIDIMILIDDASIKWDQELISWYRTELEKVIQANP